MTGTVTDGDVSAASPVEALDIALMYDSVIALAQAYHSLWHSSSLPSSSGAVNGEVEHPSYDVPLYGALLDVDFAGSTGTMTFTNTTRSSSSLGGGADVLGERSSGVVYAITNFNGTHDNVVGDWSRRFGVNGNDQRLAGSVLVWGDGATAVNSGGYSGQPVATGNVDGAHAWVGAVPYDTVLQPCTLQHLTWTSVPLDLSRMGSATCDEQNRRTLTYLYTRRLMDASSVCCNRHTHPRSVRCWSGLLYVPDAEVEQQQQLYDPSLPHHEWMAATSQRSRSLDPMSASAVAYVDVLRECDHVSTGSDVAVGYSIFAGCTMAMQVFLMLLIVIYRRHPLMVAVNPAGAYVRLHSEANTHTHIHISLSLFLFLIQSTDAA